MLCASAARAETAAPYRVRFDTAPYLECPGVSSFVAQIEARTQRVRWARADEGATLLAVAISGVPGGAAGALIVQTADGATSEREVTAASCEQVVSALALVTALAIDPDASTAPIAQPPLSPPPPAPPSPAIPPEARWAWQIGVSGEMVTAFAPQPALWARPHVEVARGGVAARLSAGWARATARGAQGAAELTLVAGRLEGCPFRLDLGNAVQVTPCAVIDAGGLTARGVDVTPSAEVVRPWLTGGAGARLSVSALSPVVLEIGGELFAPFVRDRFYVQTDATLHRTPAVGGAVGVGIGVRFP